MKLNSLLRLSMLSLALSAGPSHSQFASGQYEFYGRMNVTAYNISNYNDSTNPALTKVNSVGSRIGFRFDKAFNEDLSGTFRVEGGVTADGGTADVASREASVGLKSKQLGWLRAGFMLTPLDDLHNIAGPGYLTSVTNDNFSGFWANGYSNMFSSGGTTGCSQVAGTGANNTFGFDNRYGNSVRYDSPTIAGLSAAAHISLGETKKSDGCTPYALSTKVQYESGPIRAAIAYNNHHNLRGANLNDNIIMLAAGYQFGKDYNLGAYLQKVTYANPGKNALTQTGFAVRGRAFFGLSTLELGWYHAGEGKGDQTSTFSGLAVGSKTSANIYLVGYRYQIDKAMELWSQVAVLKNGSAASYDLGGGGASGTAATLGASPRTVAIGIKYDF